MSTAIGAIDKDDPASLPALLAALADGARATNCLPVGKKQKQKVIKSSDAKKTNDDSSASSSDDDDDNEFMFQMAFSEFRNLVGEARKRVVNIVDDAVNVALISTCSSTSNSRDLLTNLLSTQVSLLSTQKQSSTATTDVVDWVKCGDVCDSLLDEIERHVLFMKEGNDTTIEPAYHINNTNNKRQDKSFRHILSNVRSMEKPQITFHFEETNVNSRTLPFVPRLSSSLQSLPGHGLSIANLSEEEQNLIVAPDVHYTHPYETEIRQFAPCLWQLEPPSFGSSNEHRRTSWNGIPQTGVGGTLREGVDPDYIPPTDATFIDTEEALCHFVAELELHQIREIAVDLEAHSHRSFLGFVCLMQISVRWPTTVQYKNDIILDTLALRKFMGRSLLPMFANPSICKIMHGADSDILWLQRDFGIYVVNLFDTHQASIELALPSRSLASLLNHYAHVDVDKAHQLSDWRQRPLPKDMLNYAQSDTHYLIDIYDCMRRDLVIAAADSSSSRIIKVLDKSRQICLKKCSAEPFHPMGWKKILRAKRGRQQHVAQLSKQHERCLSMLWDWRDAVARKHDESVTFVCQNHSLIRIAQMQPKSVSDLARLLNPMPELIREYSHEIIDFVQQSVRPYVVDHNKATTVPITTSTTTDNLDTLHEEYDLLPSSSHPSDLPLQTVIPTDDTSSKEQEYDTAEEDLLPAAKRRTRTLEINPSNADFICTNYTPHSLELGLSSNQGRGVTVDGLGAIKVTLNYGNADVVSKATLESIKTANTIRLSLEGKKNLLNLACTSFMTAEPDATTKKSTVSNETTSKLDEEMPISLKEAYNMNDRITLPEGKRQHEDLIVVDPNDDSTTKKKKKLKVVTIKTSKSDVVIEPFDYSKTNSVGILGSSRGGLLANPFFSGAAASGSSTTTTKHGNPKSTMAADKSPKHSGQQPKPSSEKSFVYSSTSR